MYACKEIKGSEDGEAVERGVGLWGLWCGLDFDFVMWEGMMRAISEVREG